MEILESDLNLSLNFNVKVFIIYPDHDFYDDLSAKYEFYKLNKNSKFGLDIDPGGDAYENSSSDQS